MLTFGLLSFVMIVGALGVITLKQPVHAALSLVGTLLTLAVTYVTLEAHFLAAIQVIVYAGAIMVLFLFVIMLLNVQGEERETSFAWMRPAAYATGVIAAAGIIISAFRTPGQLPEAAVIAAALDGGSAGALGEALFTDFVLAFQLVGVLLLTGIIGAVSLVQRKAETAAQVQERAAVTAPSGGGVAVLERSGPDETVPPGKISGEAASSPPTSTLKPAPNTRTEAEQAKVKPTPPELQPAGSAQTESGDEGNQEGTDKDDLKRISGVGPKLEELLNRNGIRTFEQIASLNPDEVAELEEKLESFKGRIERDEWLKQARELAEEKHDRG